MHKLAILLSVLLIAGSTVPFIPSVLATHGGPHSQIKDLGSGRDLVNGSFVYVDVTTGSSPTVNFRVDHPVGSEVVVPEILSNQLPGAEFYSSSSTVSFFSWPIGDVLKDIVVPATYAVTFNTIGSTGAASDEEIILISIANGVPPVTVTLDRTGYKPADKARITIVDDRANLNDLPGVSETITASVSVIGGLSALPVTVTLTETEEPGKFVYDYTVPSSGNSIKVVYKGQAANAKIGRALSMDGTNYYMEDQVQLEVVDLTKKNNAGIDIISAKLSTTSSPGKKNLLLIEVGNSGIFRGTFKISESSGVVAGVKKLAAEVGDTITVTYGSDQVVRAAVIKWDFKFGRTAYSNSSFATITIVDKTLNDDKNVKDTVTVQVTGHDPSIAKSFTLIESGPDAAIFHTYLMPLITNNHTLSEINDYAIFIENGDKIRARYDDKITEATANVVHLAAEATDGPGAGGSESQGADAQIVFPGISMVDCGGADTDKDGICNTWETSGFLKIPYPNPNSQKYAFSDSCVPYCPSSTKKDVYLEVDYDGNGNYYTSTDLNTALSHIRTEFAGAPFSDSAGAVLHYKVNDRILDIPSPGTVNIWSDSDVTSLNSYTELKTKYFGTTADVKSWPTPPNINNKKYAWAQVAHYALVIKQQTDDSGSSGIAEWVGDDIVVSLAGSFTVTVPKLEGTIMHELGHNFGLNHGGGIAYASYPPEPGAPEEYTWIQDDDVNCKPNYPSVMSYMRQFSYDAFAENTLDYSAGVLSPSLNWTDLDEYLGLRPETGSIDIVYGVDDPASGQRIPNAWPTPSSIDWDWDNNGLPNDVSAVNPVIDIDVFGCNAEVNPLPDPHEVLLSDYDDWDHLVMNYRYYNPASLGTGFRTVTGEDLSEVGWDDIKELSVVAIDSAIQQLEDDISFEGVDESPNSSSVTLTFASSVDFSRTTLPIPPQAGSATADLIGSDKVVTTLIVTDPDLNNNNGSQDSTPFLFGTGTSRFTVDVEGDGFNLTIDGVGDYTGSGCLVFEGVCLADILPELPELGETGQNTNVFDDEVEFVRGGLSLSDWQDLEITFNYHDADGNEESATITFRSYNGSLTIDPASAMSNTTLTLTVTDADLNLDDEEIEEFEGSIVSNNDALLTVETKDDAIGGVITQTFEETGEDTGIFMAEYEVDSDIPTSDSNSTAASILVTYNDEITQAGGSDRIEVVVPIVSSTGTIIVTPKDVYPTTTLTVLIVDSDLDQDHSAIDEYDTPDPDDDNFFVSFRTDRNEVGVASPNIEETGANTGVFEFEIELVSDDQACEADDLSDPLFDAEGGSDPSIGVCPDDLLSIRYEDNDNGSGQQVTVSRVIQIKPALEQFQEKAHNILIMGDNGMPSVVDNVQGSAAEVEQAVEQLKMLRTMVDGSVGGDPSDDELAEYYQIRVIPILDNTLTMLELVELNEPYDPGHKSFTLTSHRGINVYTIGAEAETITPVVDSFVINPVSKELELKLIGSGDIEFTIPHDLTGEVTDVIFSGEQIEFEEIASNTTHTTYLVEDLPYTVGKLSLSYGPPPSSFPITLTKPTIKDVTGSSLFEVVKGSQVMLTTTAKNELATAQSLIAIIEVRDSNDVTTFIGWYTGTLNAGAESEVGLSWTPDESDTYEIRAFAISDLIKPQVLSQIESATVTVVDRLTGGGTVVTGGGTGGGMGTVHP